MVAVKQLDYKTPGGIQIRRASVKDDYPQAIERLTSLLDERKGVLLSSSYEYPGRYTRWDIGFVNPPLQIVSRARKMRITALNMRGEILLPAIYFGLQHHSEISDIQHGSRHIEIEVKPPAGSFREEERSRQPTVFSVLRALINIFRHDKEGYLGLYGAFGYDLGFQFEDVNRHQHRNPETRDLVLYLPDQILVADHRIGETICHSYEFVCRNWDSSRPVETTGGFRRNGTETAYSPAIRVQTPCDHEPGEYAATVEKAKEYFSDGRLFEVVPGQTFYEPCRDKPSEVFKRLKEANPAPYGALMNLGEREYLVAASPEMFVRVDGSRIETCPISGTIGRGHDAISDARQVQKLLNSAKDEAELSMCTDVDRNDKARVCIPGSVRVIGRRQIELYSRLIHTVDHVTGTLDEPFDALDGFLAHTWAVTVTGAPKHSAMQFIEDNEKSPRRWYGGAMGCLGFDGNINTGLTLRTLRIKDGIGEIRVGATLLMDSEPVAEEAETRLKASALMDAIRGNRPQSRQESAEIQIQRVARKSGAGLQVLMIDHQDSFVHNLGAYFRSCGVSLITLRPGNARYYLRHNVPDLVVCSPGPGRPDDFDMASTLKMCHESGVPVFGVCLGLQGLLEYFGGTLNKLDYPVHGKASLIAHTGGVMFRGIANEFHAGRYHSLVADQVPACFDVVARSPDHRVMAIEHRNLPMMAVQFHPESIMSMEENYGLRLIANVVEYVAQLKAREKAG